jgi:electron transport complex protein RnfD
MLDVIIALLPSLAVAAYMFGIRAILLAAVSSAACVFFEWAYRRVMKKPSSITDLSAVVTGLLLAYCVPVTTPFWTIIIGDFFAIILVKQLFGGIGKNFVNPALAARAFMFSWPVIMTTWVAPLSYKSFFTLDLVDAVTTATVDAVTAATPLASLANGVIPSNVSLLQAFAGQVGGSMGEISAFALLLGGVYLLVRRVITPVIPLSYLLSVAFLTFLFPLGGSSRLSWMLWQLCSGGLMLGAIFMATDYTTSPVNPKAQIIFGIGCGAVTVFIRYFGAYVEGTSYAILLMNTCAWLLDKSFSSGRFGVTREMRQRARADKKAAAANTAKKTEPVINAVAAAQTAQISAIAEVQKESSVKEPEKAEAPAALDNSDITNGEEDIAPIDTVELLDAITFIENEMPSAGKQGPEEDVANE